MSDPNLNPRASGDKPSQQRTLLASVTRPIFIRNYLHRVAFLCRTDPRHDPQFLARLRGHYHGRLRFKKRRWGPGLVLHVKVPDAVAMTIFAEHTDWRVSSLEIARDFIFNHQHEADAWKLMLVRHLVVPHAGRRHLKRSYMNSDYWGQPQFGRATNFPVAYSDGERNCCHLEWRFHGCEAVKRHLDIRTPADLHRRSGELLAHFWDKHLDLRGLDFARLGRDERNRSRERGQPRRRGYYPDDADHGRRQLSIHGGHWLQRGTQWTMQQYIKQRGVGRAVIRLALPTGFDRIDCPILRRPPPTRGG